MASLTERLTPRRADAIDLVACLVATGLALGALSTSFDGWTYLVVGLSGAVLGVTVSWVSIRLQVSWLAAAAVLLVVFVVAGQGLATRGRSLGGVVPTLESLRGLVDGLVHGWSRLLTSLPRSGTEDNVLAVPYLMGFVGALTASLLALRVRRWPLCVVPAFVVLAGGILLGTLEPASLVLQGGGLAVVALAWASYRQQRNVVVARERARSRALRAAALLGASAAAAGLLSSHLPFVDTDSRTTVREYVTPPLDLSQLASPLGAYRAWLDEERKESLQATLDNWPKGARLRLAVMDDYDGLVWNLSDAEVGGSSVFERVGTTLPDAPSGPTERVIIRPEPTMRPYLPTAGTVRSITPIGEDTDDAVSGLRVSLSTETALQTRASAYGSRYAVTTQLPVDPDPDVLERAAFDLSSALPPIPANLVPADLKSDLEGRVAGAETAYAKATALEKTLQAGYYSDGGKDLGIAPGHSFARIVPDFLLRPELARGNGEQYAAAMAFAARALGMPARVVMGFVPPGEGHVEVKGGDVAAWVEIAFQDVGWLTFDPTPPKTRVPPKQLLEEQKKQQIRPLVPPLVRPQAVTPDLQEQTEDDEEEEPQRAAVREERSALVGVLLVGAGGLGLLLLLASPALAVLAIKARRRRRRQSEGDAWTRISAGWQEVVDTARDAGHELPRHSTRTELVGALPLDELEVLAREADRASFSHDLPDENAVAGFWLSVRLARRRLVEPLTRRQRVRAAISLRSLRTRTA